MAVFASTCVFDVVLEYLSWIMNPILSYLALSIKHRLEFISSLLVGCSMLLGIFSLNSVRNHNFV